MIDDKATTTSPFRIGFAWVLVGIPLFWGVLETVKKSLALFH